MTYKEYRERQSAELNDLPIFWAFSNKQFKEAMEERGLTENDTDKIYSLGAGGFYLRSDAEKIRDYFNKPDMLHDLMSDTIFAKEAFLYEMYNHEYSINYQADWDVCGCFGDCEYGSGKSYEEYLSEMGYSAETISAYKAARKEYYKRINEEGDD